MKWRFLCGFSAAASLLLAICANAAAATKNIDIVVTHGAGSGTPITTMTIQNGDPSNPIVPGAPGYPYIAGQAFVRSNGNGIAWTGINSYPICEDASSSALSPASGTRSQPAARTATTVRGAMLP